MGIEIERKFLVAGSEWRQEIERSSRMLQGYLRAEDATVRVRIDGAQAYLTLKGRTLGVTRSEWEYPIPVADAEELIAAFCGTRLIEKTRHYVNYEGHEWTIDEFAGRHEGLLLAEIELSDENQQFACPDWLGEEVSTDPQYFNSQLAKA